MVFSLFKSSFIRIKLSIALVIIGLIISMGCSSSAEEVTDSIAKLRLQKKNASPSLQRKIGTMYFEGIGTNVNVPEGMFWYISAAQAGDVEAEVILGKIYAQSDKIPQNYLESFKYYYMAANQSNIEAERRLSDIYLQGLGVKKDVVQAYMWNEIAVKHLKPIEVQRSNLSAQRILLENLMTKAQITDAKIQAYEWNLHHKNYSAFLVGNNISAAKISAQNGDASAQAFIGSLYFQGKGVPQNNAEGFKWSFKAAEQGNVDGQYNLALAYGKGAGVKRDATEGVKWLKKAADQKDAGAEKSLGIAYHNGEGVPKDYVLSWFWLNQAALQGDKEAQKWRDRIEENMTSEQIVRAKKLKP